MTPQTTDRLVKGLVIAARIIVGAVFIVSGIAKGIDIWGTVYKMEEYLHVWGITQPRTFVFMGALCLSGAEFILGILTLFGCCRRWAPILLAAIMAGMLPLTLYIYIADPVADCGCFGDMMVISNGATFWKNVVLTALIVVMLIYNRKARPLFSAYSQWLVVALSGAYFIVVALYGYNIQPMVDFRSFPVGAAVLPAGDDEADDAVAVTFVYEKDGEQREFGLDNLPDSTWTFIDQKMYDTGSRQPSELFIFDADGEDVTAEAISTEGDEMILVIPQMARAEVSWTFFLNEISDYMLARGGSMIAIVAGGSTAINAWTDLSMASYPVYTAESTSLKELARGNMALVFLRDGRVAWKRSMALMDTESTDALLFDGDDPALFAADDTAIFRWLTGAWIISLLLLYALDSTGRLLRWRLARHKARREGHTPAEKE